MSMYLYLRRGASAPRPRLAAADARNTRRESVVIRKSPSRLRYLLHTARPPPTGLVPVERRLLHKQRSQRLPRPHRARPGGASASAQGRSSPRSSPPPSLSRWSAGFCTSSSRSAFTAPTGLAPVEPRLPVTAPPPDRIPRRCQQSRQTERSAAYPRHTPDCSSTTALPAAATLPPGSPTSSESGPAGSLRVRGGVPSLCCCAVTLRGPSAATRRVSLASAPHARGPRADCTS